MLEFLSNQKCKITKGGILVLKRKEKYVTQYCWKEESGNYCDHRCPLFFESKLRSSLISQETKGVVGIKESDMVILGCSFGSQIAYEIELDER